MNRGVRVGLKIAKWLVTALVIVLVAAMLVLKSGWFHQEVKKRIVAELERATGGTATLGDWIPNWRLFTVKFNDLTLHGTEPASVPPLLQAKSIQVDLKIVSFWKRDVDVQSVVVSEPKVDLIVAPDGSTNIPAPKVRQLTGKIGFEPILDWKISKFALENGVMLFAEKKSGINATGENLRAQLSYDLTGPRYKGQVTIQPLELRAGKLAPANMDVFLVLGLERNRIDVTSAKFDMKDSHLEASGAIEDMASPKGAFRFTAHLAVEQANQLLKARVARRGTVELAGSANYTSSSDYTVIASMNARDLDVDQAGIRVSHARATSTLRLDPHGLKLDALVLDALGGRFTGRADFPKLERFVVDGTVHGMPIQQALGVFAPRIPAHQKAVWSGRASGPVHLEGGLTGGALVATAHVSIAPAPGGIPVQGSIDARYDGRSGALSLGKSYLTMPGGRLDLSGALGSQLDVRLTSTNLDDLLPAINAFSKSPVNSLPIQLKNGNATFDGTVTGKLDSPRIAGAVTLTNFVYSGIGFDRFTGQVALDQSSLQLQNGALARGATQAQIAGTVGLTEWKPEPAGAIAATATIRGAEISELLNLAGQKQVPVSGALTASLNVSGSIGAPRASVDVTVLKGVAYDEPFDRLQATIDYSPRAVDVRQIKLTAGPAQLSGSVSFEPTRPFTGAPEFRDGKVHFQVSSNEMAVQRFQTMKRLRPDVSGMVRANIEGSADVHEAAAPQSPRIILTSLNGDVTAHDLRMENRNVGNVKLAAQTQAQVLKLQLDSNFLNSNLAATGQWRLVPGYPGEANVRFSQISLGTVRDWFNKSGEKSTLNFDGSAEGTVSIAGPALEPRAWKASARFSKIEVYPLDTGERRGIVERFTLRNEGPVVLTLEKGVVNVASAHLTGASTDFTLTGRVALEPKTSLDLRVNGTMNLAVLQNFDPDIETSGAVTVNASIRGTLDQLQTNGRLDVKGGALHFADITTGLSDATGTLLFNGTQAILQDVSGVVGGGKVVLSGVVGIAVGDLSYRVDITADNVRVRYPEGASTSANAQLTLRGTSQRSTVSGLITVLRTGFNPHTDFSSILGKASQPVRTPSNRSGPLSGMHFDIGIETAPDISFESSLTEDLQVEGNLRLQGTPYNPVLLGRLNITQGQVNFFGTKYTINQGSVTFANPVKLEPVLNVDLETRVQGIDVILTISGPVTNLNVTPRSDPPLEFSQVLALLATGSAPSSDPTLASRQNATTQTFTQLGASALIGQVVANPVSSRLQRFFGVSRLKIDPQLTGVENNPQARLTLEQQINRNLTFTYITNLASSNQQIVRVEWALNKRWSVIAVRDENGLFGLDFLFKKRFK